jgi:RimJ/RimL family protein N-acetyltransferase
MVVGSVACALVIYPQEVLTARLHLLPMCVDDASDLFVILSNPAGWWYDPAGRHAHLETTIGFVERASARWTTDRLSYWTARRRTDGVVVGLGGAQRHRTGTWNLNYRIAATEQRQGLATELAAAAREAAASVDPDVALVAWIAENNFPSLRVAERIGLVNRGVHLDENDGQMRLAYSDRPLSGR